MGARGCGNLHVCFVGERAQLPALRAWLALALRGQNSAGRCVAPQPARSSKAAGAGVTSTLRCSVMNTAARPRTTTPVSAIQRVINIGELPPDAACIEMKPEAKRCPAQSRSNSVFDRRYRTGTDPHAGQVYPHVGRRKKFALVM